MGEKNIDEEEKDNLRGISNQNWCLISLFLRVWGVIKIWEGFDKAVWVSSRKKFIKFLSKWLEI